jgi:predicted O-methyltransferase YrrM
MTEYQFTKDWFQWAPEVWTQLIPLLPERKKFLEIGSFEGRSTAWIIENMLDDEAVPGGVLCIDTWEGGEEHGEEDMSEVEKRFNHNVHVAQTNYWKRTENMDAYSIVDTFKGKSDFALAHIRTTDERYWNEFDFIYIDGSHIAKDVLTDACMAWPLLKPKGLMVFDDYLWTPNARDILHRPKAAIDAFVNLFAEEVEIVHVGYQLVVRKKGE